MECKLFIGVTDIESLTIDCANRHSEFVRVDLGKFGNVIGQFSIDVKLTFLVDVFDRLFEFFKLWNDLFVEQ